MCRYTRLSEPRKAAGDIHRPPQQQINIPGSTPDTISQGQRLILSNYFHFQCLTFECLKVTTSQGRLVGEGVLKRCGTWEASLQGITAWCLYTSQPEQKVWNQVLKHTYVSNCGAGTAEPDTLKHDVRQLYDTDFPWGHTVNIIYSKIPAALIDDMQSDISLHSRTKERKKKISSPLGTRWVGVTGIQSLLHVFYIILWQCKQNNRKGMESRMAMASYQKCFVLCETWTRKEINPLGPQWHFQLHSVIPWLFNKLQVLDLI